MISHYSSSLLLYLKAPLIWNIQYINIVGALKSQFSVLYFVLPAKIHQNTFLVLFLWPCWPPHSGTVSQPLISAFTAADNDQNVPGLMCKCKWSTGNIQEETQKESNKKQANFNGTGRMTTCDVIRPSMAQRRGAAKLKCSFKSSVLSKCAKPDLLSQSCIALKHKN